MTLDNSSKERYLSLDVLINPVNFNCVSDLNQIEFNSHFVTRNNMAKIDYDKKNTPGQKNACY